MTNKSNEKLNEDVAMLDSIKDSMSLFCHMTLMNSEGYSPDQRESIMENLNELAVEFFATSFMLAGSPEEKGSEELDYILNSSARVIDVMETMQNDYQESMAGFIIKRAKLDGKLPEDADIDHTKVTIIRAKNAEDAKRQVEQLRKENSTKKAATLKADYVKSGIIVIPVAPGKPH